MAVRFHQKLSIADPIQGVRLQAKLAFERRANEHAGLSIILGANPSPAFIIGALGGSKNLAFGWLGDCVPAESASADWLIELGA